VDFVWFTFAFCVRFVLLVWFVTRWFAPAILFVFAVRLDCLRVYYRFTAFAFWLRFIPFVLFVLIAFLVRTGCVPALDCFVVTLLAFSLIAGFVPVWIYRYVGYAWITLSLRLRSLRFSFTLRLRCTGRFITRCYCCVAIFVLIDAVLRHVVAFEQFRLVYVPVRVYVYTFAYPTTLYCSSSLPRFTGVNATLAFGFTAGRVYWFCALVAAVVWFG